MKLYLLFRIESDNSCPDQKDLCDIFSTKERADKEAEERNNRIKAWSPLSYQVEEWEVQE